MNAELESKLQAWVDGELPNGEARRVAAFVEADKDARTLVAELKMTRGLLKGNEPEMKLPESREFYWSKIQREIERLDKVEAPERSLPWLLLVRRFLAPLSGVALVAFLSIISLNLIHQPGEDPARQLVETENLSEHVGSISYRSQSDNMFVVYLYAKDADNADAEMDPEAVPDDLIIQ